MKGWIWNGYQNRKLKTFIVSKVEGLEPGIVDQAGYEEYAGKTII